MKVEKLKNRGRQEALGFIAFIRERGVVGLAIGFVMGGSVSKLVTSFVEDIVQPLIGLILGSTEGLNALRFHSIMVGEFLAALIDFFILAFVIYFSFRFLRLDKLDKTDKP